MNYDYLFSDLEEGIEYIAFLIHKKDLKYCRPILDHLLYNGYKLNHSSMESRIDLLTRQINGVGYTYITIAYDDDNIYHTGTDLCPVYGRNDEYDNHYIMDFKNVFKLEPIVKLDI